MTRCSFFLATLFLSTAAFPAICAAQQPAPEAPPQAAPAQPAPAPSPGSPATYPPPPPPAGQQPPPAGQQPPPQSYPPPQGYPPPPSYPPPPPAYPPPAESSWNAPPAYLPYEPDKPIPPGYTLESRVRRGPIIAGAIVLGVPYVLGVAFTDLEEERIWLVVPVAGPWLTLAGGDYTCDPDDPIDCTDERAGRTFLILDGLMQGAGAALLIYGLASTSERLVRQDLYRGQLRIAPQFSANAAGLVAFGEF